ncbi:MAG: VCBS repeat-containing protein [Acidobacteria bacterium]|nr:VCBS repeat-containing protein [Acidobacteriota bacterium]
MAVSNYETNDVSILLGKGDGTFQAARRFPVVTPWFITTGDFNLDGNPDIATSGANAANMVSVLLGDGQGNLGQFFKVGPNPSAIAAADLDNDGNLDVLVTSVDSHEVWVLYGDGTGGLSYGPITRVEAFPANSRPVSVAVGQINSDVDSRLDIATANFGTNSVSILLQTADGQFAGRSFAVGANPNAIVLGDFDGDQKLDIATANYGSNNVTVLLGDGRGGVRATRTFSLPANAKPWQLAAADLNGDGKLDLVVVDSGIDKISVLLGDGRWSTGGGFEPARDFSVQRSPHALAIADINGDGKLDVVVANTLSNSITVLLGDGRWSTPGGGFRQPPSHYTVGPGGAEPDAIVIRDFDGDAKLDVAVANFESNNVTVLKGNGAGGFTATSHFFAGLGLVAITSADLNGDNRQDLVMASSLSNTISILFNSSGP